MWSLIWELYVLQEEHTFLYICIWSPLHLVSCSFDLSSFESIKEPGCRTQHLILLGLLSDQFSSEQQWPAKTFLYIANRTF
jgi:hypothetical protein